MFTYYSISALINFIFSLLASVFLIVTNKKNLKDNITFAFLRFAFFVIFWSAFYFLWQMSKDYNSAFLYSKILIAFAAFIPIAYLDYVFRFLGYNNKKSKILILLGYVVFAGFVLKGLVLNVTPKLVFSFWPNGTDIFPLFFLLWGSIFILSIIILFFNFFKISKNNIKRSYILFLAVAITTGVIGGSTNYFLWFNIPIKPFGNVLVSIYFFMTLYTVRKYDVINLRLFYIQLPSLVISMFAFGRIFVATNQFDFYTDIVFFFVVSIASIYIIRSSNEQEKNQFELQKALEKVKTMNLKLVEIDKHKSDFVSIAAHQLRTPATVIKNYTSMIEQGIYGNMPEKFKDPIDRISENGTLLAETITSILDISHIEGDGKKIEMVDTDIKAMLTKIMQDFDDKDKNHGLEVKFESKEGDSFVAEVDAGKLEHVFINLIDNSIKYTDKGGVYISLYNKNGSVCVDVKDTGRGMSEEFVKTQLYQKFAREESVASNISGNGLGMYFVKEVLDMHHGEISLETKVGEGSKFTVEIPKKQPKIKERRKSTVDRRKKEEEEVKNTTTVKK